MFVPPCRIEEEQRKLEKMKQQMIFGYQNWKLSGSSTSSNSFEASTGILDSHQMAQKPSPTAQSPSHAKKTLKQAPQNESTENPLARGLLQKGGNKSLADKLMDVEKQIKDRLTGDMLNRGAPLDHHKQPAFRPHDDAQPGIKSSLVSPPSSKHLPTTTSSQSDPSKSNQQTSPPPRSVGVQTFQIQTSPSSSINYTGPMPLKSFSSRSESSTGMMIQPWYSNPDHRQSRPGHRKQWTEFTSAPTNIGSGRGWTSHEAPLSDQSSQSTVNRRNLSVGTSAGRDMSEFDPITLRSTASHSTSKS